MKICSFCAKPQREVEVLIEAGTGALICDECIGLSMALIKRGHPHVFFRIVKFDSAGVAPCDAPKDLMPKREEPAGGPDAPQATSTEVSQSGLPALQAVEAQRNDEEEP
jgi:hypothetical protein